ncbi:MAG: hypothetical protein AAFV45_03055 [Pseudomonadota bacterium]
MDMGWYGITLLVGYEYVDYVEGDDLLVEEQVIIVEAKSIDEARSKADTFGQPANDSDPSLTRNGRRAKSKFLGILRTLTTQSQNSGDTGILEDRSEISFSRYLVSSVGDVERLKRGENIDVTLLADDVGSGGSV